MPIFNKDKLRLAKQIQFLLLEKKIKTIFMKLYSNDDDLDLVIINKNDYYAAQNIIIQDGWQKKNNLSKIRERDKDLFQKQKEKFSLHLHQSFSWNTIPYLNSQKLWGRKIKTNNILIPSPEDELLIIAAHSLYENKKIMQEEFLYGQNLLKQKLDFSYCLRQATAFNWQRGWRLILEKIKTNQPVISIKELLETSLEKLKLDLFSFKLNLAAKELFNYLLIDWIWCYRNMLLENRKNRFVISFSGLDGTGKTTQAQKLLQTIRNQGFSVKIAHIGTGPMVLASQQDHKSRLPGIFSFIKDSCQILTAYFFSSEDFLLFDRYIYDTLVKIAYKQESHQLSPLLINLCQQLPQPKIPFLLKINPSVAFKRDKDHLLPYFQKKHYLYNQLGKYFPLVIINANLSKEKVAKQINQQAPKH